MAETLRKNFTIYRSSAGSGKTYTLTREYLSLALQQPDYFRQILAVTFTNKATEEMKSRIVETLHGLSTNRPVAMQAELLKATELSPEALQERAKEVLSAILHNYGHFAVTTIDSFFQQVIRAFAREVGLSAGFKVELDQEKVLDDLLDMLLAEVGENRELTDWMTEYAARQVEEGKNWDIRADLRQLAREIFSESFKRHEKSLQQQADSPGKLYDFRRSLYAIVNEFEGQMQELGRQAQGLINEHGLSLLDFPYKASSFANYFYKIDSRGDAKMYIPGTRAEQAAEDPEKWYSKSTDDAMRFRIEAARDGGLLDLLQGALTLYHTDYNRYLSARQALRFLYAFGLLVSITDKLRQYREEEDLMLISDASQFLREIIGENEAPFIYEKTGTTFRHFLIDEFQDTSGFQWENFRPLIQNSLAEGFFNLVVGDVKQSIYRWRGGDWQLLNQKIQHDISNELTAIEPLTHNWRSRLEVIAFNNFLFEKAAGKLRRQFQYKLEEGSSIATQTDFEQAAGDITRAYADVKQIFPEHKQSDDRPEGLVEVQFLSTEPGDEDTEADHWRDQAIRWMIAQVRRLQDEGYALRDMALLVRTKGEGKQLADALLQAQADEPAGSKHRFAVISKESLYVGSAAGVQLLIQALRFYNNRQDALARASLLHLYRRHIKGEPANSHELFALAARDGEEYEKQLPEEFSKKRPFLNKLPLYELVENLIRIFELTRIKNEWAYLQAFQDAVLHFTKEETGDIDSFLQWWEETGHERSVQVSDALDAIRIYTIHKSKGLQFPVVLMPFTSWQLTPDMKKSNILWAQADPDPYRQMGAVPLKNSGELNDTYFREAHLAEDLMSRIDNLNLLYVAFTRAEHALLVAAPLRLSPKNQTPNPEKETAQGLLYELLSEEIETDGILKKAGWNEDTRCFSFGSLPKLTQKLVKEEDGVQEWQFSYYPAEYWRNRLSVRRRSGTLQWSADVETRRKIDWGITMHALLAELKTKDDLPKVLHDAQINGLIDREEARHLRDLLEELLNRPQLADWFTADWKVYSELAILTAQGELSRPDRVITKGSQAIVIDYKTGTERSSDIAQVRRYMNLLHQMHYEPIEGYVLYLPSGTLKDVTR